ncbi:TonB-dependent receptor [Terriglobus roseus]|uniref:Carboxypeptidase regulatory-like domain-containing protein n=1 Tax=Terriglobus roseus TaxID=392734 RepID=A0A1H4KEG4_9BACT|nr:TonB-dependent receptor [Terriglobus roseus]SEB56448.1 Carboxypeptidase regulatory-like domain-containing protein [Terriglobus roseus]
MIPRRFSTSSLQLAAIACLSAGALSAQTSTARLTGTVNDPSGASVANATVVITNETTGQVRTVTTNANGLFIAVSLPPAPYDIRVSGDGFSSIEQKNVTLAVGQELTMDLTLPLAGAETSVTVNAGSIIDLDTSSARIGGNVPTREIQQLPINGRQISQLYLLTPGATNTGSGQFGDIRFSGRAVEQNIIRLDGIESTSIIDTTPGNLNGELASLFRLQQSLEAVQEFRVDSSNYPAELGTGTGGQISFVTKSGGNRLHGSAFEYVRNDFFDARNYFNRRTATPTAIVTNSPKFRLNQFGGSVGGPLIKDKLFVAAVYEGLRQTWAVPYSSTTLSAAQRALVTNPQLTPLLAAFPIANNGAAGVISVGQNRLQEDFGHIRFDYRLNDRFSMYARYNRDQGTSRQIQDASLSAFGQVEVPQNGVLAVNQVWTPRLFNETKFGYNGIKMRVQGIAGASPNANLSAARISIAGITNVGALISLSSSFNGVGAPYTGQSYSYIDNLSYVVGNHNLKFGAEIRPLSLYNDQIGGTTYTYNSFANFQNNVPDSIAFYGNLSDLSPFTGLSGNAKVKQSYYIGYAQDEWKATPNLTVSYGLRYEFYSPLHEARNKDVFFDMNVGNIVTKYSGDWFKSTQNFGPRLGITYAPAALHNNTVVRVGGGWYFGPGQTEDQIQPEANDRVTRTFTNTGGVATSGKVYPINPVSDVYANYDINSTTLGYQPRAYAPNYKVPEKIVSYTASVQQQLPGGMQMMIGYVGSTGRNLFLRSITNLITNVTTNAATGAGTAVRQYGGRFAEIDYKTSGGVDQYHALQTSLQRRFTRGVSLGAQYTWAKELGTSSGSNEATTSQAPLQIYGQAPEYGRGINDVRHSLNMTALFDMPFGKGKRYDLGGLGNTVAGGWQIGSIVNFRSGVPIDVLITRPDVVYVGNAGTAYAGQVFSSPVLAGTAVQTTAVINTPGGGNTRNIRRPNRVAGVNPYLKNGIQYLNPAAFSTPAPGTFGNQRRNDLSGPNLAQIDMTLSKEFVFTERLRFKFTADAFNVLNHANFANPGTVRLPQSIPTAPGAANTIQPGTPFSLASSGIGTFGQYTATVGNQVGLGAQRQIQLSGRLSF